MKKYYGYAGKILRVNLTDKKITKEIISDETARKYIGGNGFGVKYLYDEVPAKIDPLGVENKLFIMTGPTEGTMVPGAGRACIITKSPLNNRFIDSYFGGHFGGEVKFAGYDGIIIEGKSDTPVYIKINDDDVKIEEASSIWGMSTIDAQKEVKKEIGEEYATLAIGIAGENLVPMACIISGVNAAGRGGTGAVMGSKNLKLIAVKGTNGVKVADIEGLNAYSLDVINRMKAHPGMGRNLPAYGTTGSPKTNNDLGIFGTRNWQQEQFEDASIISGPYFKDKLGYGDGSNTCLACPIACSQITKVKTGKFKDAITIGPEYETLFSLGSICGNGNIDYIVKGDQFCDELGIDTISAGVTIAFAMECFERGILTLDDTEGIDLRFGNSDAIITLLEKIAKLTSANNKSPNSSSIFSILPLLYSSMNSKSKRCCKC
jgi:aldehyde:ferredoxin oxidoreductase